ncbi:hypothetical protein AAC387_Pa11g0967 [Persea americana]
MWKHIQEYAVVDDERKKWMKNNFCIDPLTFLVKTGPGLCNIGAIQTFRSWLRKIRRIAGAKQLNIQGGLRVLLDIEMRRTDGSIPSRADLFFRTHTRKDGTPVDEKSAEIISKFKEPSATQERGSSSSIGDKIYTQATFDELQNELSSVLEQMDEWKKNQEEEKCKMEDLLKNQEEEKRKMEDLLKNQEEEMRKMEELLKNQEEEKRARMEEMKLIHGIIIEMKQWLFAQQQDPSERGADG